MMATMMMIDSILSLVKERTSSAWSSSTANPVIVSQLNRRQACAAGSSHGIPGNPLPRNRGNAGASTVHRRSVPKLTAY